MIERATGRFADPKVDLQLTRILDYLRKLANFIPEFDFMDRPGEGDESYRDRLDQRYLLSFGRVWDGEKFVLLDTTNYITDPDFSLTTAINDSTYWSFNGTSKAWDSTSGYGGSPCAKLTASQTLTGNKFSWTSGDYLYMEVRFSYDQGFAGTVTFGVEGFDAGSSSLGNLSETRDISIVEIGSTEWPKFGALFRPTDATLDKLRAFFSVVRTSASGALYVDSVRIRIVPSTIYNPTSVLNDTWLTASTSATAYVTPASAIAYVAQTTAGWAHNIALSTAAADQVTWSSGNVVAQDGSTYSTAGGSKTNLGTGTTTYIYFDLDKYTGDPAVYTLQTTTNALVAGGPGKLLVAAAKKNTLSGATQCLFTTFNGGDGLNLVPIAPADDSITNAMLYPMTRGTVKVGGAGNEPTDLTANSSGYLLIGDGTDIKSVAMSGDVTISSAGATSIGTGKVTAGMHATGTRGMLQRMEASAWANFACQTSGQLVMGNGTDVVSQAMSGDITISGTGVTTIGSGKVTAGMHATGTRGMLQRMEASAWANFACQTSGQLVMGNGTDVVSQAMSGDITISGTGVTTIGSGKVTAGMHATGTRGMLQRMEASAWANFACQTAGQVVMGDGTDVVSKAISGDASLSGTGALTIAADAVSNTKLADMTRGTVKVGGTSNVPTDLTANSSGYVLVGNGTDIVSVQMSGDASISGTGSVTIAADAVSNTKLADMTRGTVKVGGTSNVPTDLNAKESGYVLVGDGTDVVSVAMSGDASIAGTGAVTIANRAVTGPKTKYTVTKVTSTSAVLTTHTMVAVECSGADITLTFTSPTDGQRHDIKKIDATAYKVIIDPGTATIDGDDTVELLLQWESVTITYYAASDVWYIT